MRALSLALALLSSSLLGASNPSSDFKAGVDAEKAGKYDEALLKYEDAKRGLAGWAVVDKQMGNSLVRLGRLEEAVKAYDRYLEQKPDDQAVRDYRDKLKAGLPGAVEGASGTAQGADDGIDGVTVFMKDNPHDYRKLRIGIETLTPIIAGFDFGWRFTKHHDFGLGYTGGGSGTTSYSLLHPRYRYHNARFLWDSFYELGLTYATAKDSQFSYSAFGLNAGIGVERVSAWPFNWFWLLSLGFVNASVSGGTFGGGVTGATVPYVIPFGFSFGLLI